MKATSLVRFTISALAAVAISGLLASGASAAVGNPATITPDAEATIGIQLTLTETNTLRFGTLSIPSATETFKITPNGSGGALTDQNTSNNNVNDIIDSSPAREGQFLVGGSGTATYGITLSGAGACTGGGGAVTLSALSLSGSTSQTLVAGADSFFVGATITVPAAATAGGVTCGYSVSVVYE